jgi:hypothetical protein
MYDTTYDFQTLKRLEGVLCELVGVSRGYQSTRQLQWRVYFNSEIIRYVEPELAAGGYIVEVVYAIWIRWEDGTAYVQGRCILLAKAFDRIRSEEKDIILG